MLLCAVLLVAGLVAGWRGLLVLHGEIGSIHIWRLLGGLGLTVVAFALLSLGFRLVLARVQDAWFWIVVAILVAVIAGLSVLACAWMAHDQLLAGWLAGGVAVAVSAVVLVAVVREYFDLSSAEDLVGALVGLALFEGAAISIAVVSGLHSHSVAAWVFGAVAALPALAGLGYLAVMMAGGVRETSASFLAQLAGLLVPVGSIVAAATWQRGSSVDGQSPALFGALGTIALLAAVAFGLQRVFLGWLSTGAAGRLDAFNAADHDEDFRSSRSAYDRERRYLEADRDADLRHLDGLARRRAEEEWSRRLESMQERWQAHRQQREQEEYERWASPRVHPGWSFPAVTDGMLRAEAQTYRRTGLALATVWPRIELVLPAQVRRPFRRAERSIGALRVAVASAVNTAISWAVIAAGLIGERAGLVQIVLVIAGPLVFAGLLLSSLRQRSTRLYRQRMDATELYRFDLARSLHVPITRDPEEFRRAAPVLMGWGAPEELTPDGDRQAVGPIVTTVTNGAVDRVASDLLEEIRNLGEEQARFAEAMRTPRLDDRQLAALADLVADRTSEPVAENVRQRLETLQQSFYQRVGKLIEQGIASSVTGPPLVDFVGFMVIDLKKDGQGSPSREPGEMLSAPVGRLLELTFYLSRDERARGLAPTLESGDQFFVVEPVQIDGSRHERSVEFEAVADSPTLTPVPNRASLTIVGEAPAEKFFSFRMPDEPGRHEIWFQLYQAGRLVQAVAIHVHARAERAPVRG